jgi:diphosphomevalonate decarboxylase
MSHPLLAAITGDPKKKIMPGAEFSAGWQSPSNIALVKYWGKTGGQVPMNPSLSMTLNNAVTTTRVIAAAGDNEKGLHSVNGDPVHPFIPKMQKFIETLENDIPVLRRFAFRVETTNSFPHSTGIASSASGLSAFALCLLDIVCKATGAEVPPDALMRMASFASRIGSGSACRSVYGGFAAWGGTERIPGSSDYFAVPVTDHVDKRFLSLRDAILIISASPKALPSSLGHQSMNAHPFREGRILQAGLNLAGALEALASGDFNRLGTIAEQEALSLHALIMSSASGTILMRPGTHSVIERVTEARKTGLPLFFTLDAGANVHLLYPADAATETENFIREELVPFCEEGRVIYDSCGTGPARLENLPK